MDIKLQHMLMHSLGDCENDSEYTADLTPV